MKRIAYWLNILAIALYEHLMMYQSAYKEDAEVNYVSILMAGIFLCFASITNMRHKFFYQSKISRLFFYLLLGMFILGVLLFRGSLLASIVNILLLSIPLLCYKYTYTLFLNNESHVLFQKSILLLFILVVLIYFKILVDLRFSGIDKALNIAYFPMILLPSILVTNPKPYIKWASIVLVCIIVFSAMKRGGIIALAGGLFVYFCVEKFNTSKINKFAALLSMALIILVFIFSFVKFDSLMGGTFSNRLENISDDGGSGRTTVYAMTFYMIQDSDLMHLLIGHGRDAVKEDSPLELSAHNDFLEFIYDYGLILFIVYLLFNIKLTINVGHLIRIRSPYAAAMAFSYVTYLVFSMISHVFLYGYFLLYILLWAYIWGNNDRDINLLFKRRYYESRNFDLPKGV